MRIDLADNTVKRVQAWVDPSRGVTEDDVINQALDCFEQRTKPAPVADRRHVENLVERFRKYRGLLAGVAIDDVVAWRHQGLP